MDARGAPHLSTLPPRLPMARCRAAQQSIGIIYLLFGKKPGAMLLGSKRGGTFEISNAVRGACEWEWRPVAHGAHGVRAVGSCNRWEDMNCHPPALVPAKVPYSLRSR
jgi:hypothetical protein